MNNALETINRAIASSKHDLNRIEETYDAVVIGAGPSGSAIASLLAEEKYRVLLLDKAEFPRAKVCGCCLSNRAIHLLDDLNRTNVLNKLQAPVVKGFLLSAGQKQLHLPLVNGRVLSRAALDSSLVFEALNAGAHFADGICAQVLESCASSISIKLETHKPMSPATEQASLRQPGRLAQPQQRIIRSRLAIVADGLGGNSLSAEEWPTTVSPDSRVGLATILRTDNSFYEEGVIYMAYGRPGYVGAVLLEDGTLNIAAALRRDFIRETGGPAAAAESILKSGGFFVPPNLTESSWKGTPALTRRRKRVAAARVFVLGDAASYVEPFTGEGIAWAFASALAITPLAKRAIEKWEDSLIEEWTGTYRSKVCRQQDATKVISWLLRHPHLAANAMRFFKMVPAIAEPLVSLVTSSPRTERLSVRNKLKERQACPRK